MSLGALNNENGYAFGCTDSCPPSEPDKIIYQCCNTNNCNQVVKPAIVNSCYHGGTYLEIKNSPLRKQSCVSPFNQYCIVGFFESILILFEFHWSNFLSLNKKNKASGRNFSGRWSKLKCWLLCLCWDLRDFI